MELERYDNWEPSPELEVFYDSSLATYTFKTQRILTSKSTNSDLVFPLIDLNSE